MSNKSNVNGMAEEEPVVFGKDNRGRVNVAIGRKLTQLREQRGLSVEQVASHLNRTKVNILGWESGFNNVPVDQMYELGRLYDVDVMEIMPTEDELEDFHTVITSKVRIIDRQGRRRYLSAKEIKACQDTLDALSAPVGGNLTRNRR